METYTRGSICSDCKMKCLFSRQEEGSNANGNSIREIIFNKGETIFKHGSFNTTAIFIKEGLLKQYIEGYRNNKDLIVRLLGPGEYLSLAEVFGRNETRYTVAALKKSEVCLVEISQLKKIITGNSSLTEILFRHFNYELDFLYYRLGIIGTKNLQGRLAEALSYIAQLEKKGLETYAHITRKDLAELSGMSVESMVRLLNEFKHDRLININGKRIEINNAEMIKILCRVG